MTWKNHPQVCWAILILCLSYLIFQLSYIPGAVLSVDEFWFGHHIYSYTQQLPYRDFLPYKTVLGYYLLSIPLYFTHTVLQPLYYIKDEIALINTLCLLGVTYWGARFFQPKAILLTLALLLANQLFLIYSVDLRVDMLTSWCGLFAMLAILSRRFGWAGIALAVSFLISQKALWFFVAINFALLNYWWLTARNWQTVRQIMLFNGMVILPLLIYLAIWSYLAGLSVVLQSVFYEGYLQAKINWYSKIYYACWHATLSNGPLLVLLWPLTWYSFFLKATDPMIAGRRILITSFAAVMMLFILSYQQAFPYHMVYNIPVFFLIYSDFFSWAFTLFKSPPQPIVFSTRKLFWFTSLYTTCIVSTIIIFGLSKAYFLIALIPVMLSLFLHAAAQTKPHIATHFPASIGILIIFCGIGFPLLTFSMLAYYVQSSYQKSMVELTHALLQEGGSYFAGTPLLYNVNQSIPGLRNLIGPSIAYLYQPNPKLLPILISSLYLTPRTSAEVLQDLQTTPVKLFVNNYRIMLLPPVILNYLFHEYEHFWGSIFLYAPTIKTDTAFFTLKFTGTYQIEASPLAQIYLDHQVMQPNKKIFLHQGVHQSLANQNYRLKLLPDITKLKLKPTEQRDTWYKMTKPIVL